MTNEELQAENARLSAAVRRLTYLAVDHGLGVWRCEKCDTRYTTLPNASVVCGEVITTYSADGPRSVPCHGKLAPFVPEPPDRK
jgi:hypothetical protein